MLLILVLAFVLVLLAPYRSQKTDPEKSFLVVTLNSSSLVRVAEATLHFDPSSLSFVEVGARTGARNTVALVTSSLSSGTVRLSVVSPNAKYGELAVVVFKIKTLTHELPTWVSTKGYKTDGSDVVLGTQSKPSYAIFDPISDYNADLWRGTY